jgi:hypothetical protein
LFSKFRKKSAVTRLSEERLYKFVLDEINIGDIRDGLWAKALAFSDGNEGKTESLYIQYRVQSIKDEFEVLEPASNQTNVSFEVHDPVVIREPLVINEHAYSFEHRGVIVKHNGKTYWVGGKSFSSSEDAKSFIDKDHQ